jgi:lipooligosaccharide transport system permease protein
MTATTFLAAFEFHMLGYRRTWRGSILSGFVQPILFVLGMGLGVGHFVDAGGGLGQVPYLDYVVPGVLASTALQVATGESMWPVMARFQWNRIYYAHNATPAGAPAILAGNLAFVAVRVLITTACYLLVTALFGALHSWLAPLALAVAVLLALAISAPVFAFTAHANSDTGFVVLYRFAVIPMTLFAGVFFPIDSLAVPLRVLAWISPLWHGTELARAATLGTATPWPVWVHLGYLALWAYAGWRLGVRGFKKRLEV